MAKYMSKAREPCNVVRSVAERAVLIQSTRSSLGSWRTCKHRMHDLPESLNTTPHTLLAPSTNLTSPVKQHGRQMSAGDTRITCRAPSLNPKRRAPGRSSPVVGKRFSQVGPAKACGGRGLICIFRRLIENRDVVFYKD